MGSAYFLDLYSIQALVLQPAVLFMSTFDSIKVENKNDIIFNTVQGGVTVADMQTIHRFFATAGKLFLVPAFPGLGVRFNEYSGSYNVLSFFRQALRECPWFILDFCDECHYSSSTKWPSRILRSASSNNRRRFSLATISERT